MLLVTTFQNDADPDLFCRILKELKLRKWSKFCNLGQLNDAMSLPGLRNSIRFFTDPDSDSLFFAMQIADLDPDPRGKE